MALRDITVDSLTRIAPGDGVAPRSWRAEERWQLDLNGWWRFRYSARLADAPQDCRDEAFVADDWDRLRVPSHWVLGNDGRYGSPIYTNSQLPIPMDPPNVPDENGFGDYRREFELPADWGKLGEIRLRFGGVESLGIVAVNGQHVGVLRGSRLVSELDVTGVVRPGRNVVHVRVAQWSAQTYVEDQDQWWLPGIFRDVTLIGRPVGGIEDYQLVADYDHATGTGTLSLTLRDATYPVRLEVPELGIAATWQSAAEIAPLPCGSVTPWSPDQPRCYDVRISNEAESIAARIGFRTIRIEGNQWLVNGRKLRLAGVNYHEFHPEIGRVFDKKAALAGLLLMKQHNINAIRTSHYPPDPRLLELADELGFWVMLECDLETHGFEQHDWLNNPADDPAWRSSLEDRMRRTVHRDKNHPSVICWSLGNECGTGANLAAMAEVARIIDPSRPVHYESDYESDYTDVVSRMYAPIPEMQAMSAGVSNALSPRPTQSSRFLAKPKLLCEYAHALGNGPGGLAEYVAELERLPDWHGGFIWEWRDHGILATTAQGTEFYAYGGDFGEATHDGSYVMDGLVHSDGRPSPAMAEVKQLFSPVILTATAQKLILANRQHHADTSAYTVTWAWEVAGERRAEGELAVPIVAAGQSADIELPELPQRAVTAADSWLTLVVRQREEQPWCDAGAEVFTTQLRLDNQPVPTLPAATAAPIRGEEVAIGSARFSRSGRLLSIGGLAITESGVELWRAPTGNDSMAVGGSYEIGDYFATTGYGLPGPSTADRWRAHGLDRLMRRTVSIRFEADDFVVVERLLPAHGRHGAEVSYRWRQIGQRLGCQVHVAPIQSRTDVTWPRIGMRLLLPEGFSQASWFGGGPGETYPDSRTACVVSQHQARVADLAFPYAVPQETGHREQLRRLELTGAAGQLRVAAFGPHLPGFSLLRHDAYELTRANHLHELPASRGLHLYLDAFQHGLGTRACGPDVLPNYQLWPRSASFGFTLEVVP